MQDHLTSHYTESLSVILVGEVWCKVTGVLITFFFVSCTMTLLLISGDRYYAIIKPLHYNLNITSRKAIIFILLVWITSLLVSIMPLIGWNQIVYQPAKAMCTVNWRSQAWLHRTYSFFIVIICLVIPYIVMIWVYVTVFREVKKATAKHRRNSLREDTQQVTPLTEDNTNNNTQGANGTNAGQVQPGREPKRRSSVTSLIHYARRRSSLMGKSLLTFHADDSRAAKTGLIIMFTFTLCWVPFAVLITFEATVPTVAAHESRQMLSQIDSGMNNSLVAVKLDSDNSSATGKPSIRQLYREGTVISHIIPEWVEALAVWFALAGCALNPIVYVFRSKNIKKEVKYCVCPGLKAEDAEKERKSVESRGSRRPSMINTNGFIRNGRSNISGLNTMIEVSSRQGSCASLDSLGTEEPQGQATAVTFHCGSMDSLNTEGPQASASASVVTFETPEGSNKDIVPL